MANFQLKSDSYVIAALLQNETIKLEQTLAQAIQCESNGKPGLVYKSVSLFLCKTEYSAAFSDSPFSATTAKYLVCLWHAPSHLTL